MTHDPKPVAVQNTNWTTVVSIGAMTGIFIIFVLVLWKAGFLSFKGDDPSSKVVAAALALVGGLVAAVVSIIGLILKYSIDQRTETRLQIEATRAAADRKAESDRANALQTQAEQRLKLEAAIRSVELFGASEGKAATLQRAGALFTLSSLDQHELTLSLTTELLQRDELEPSTACELIDRALRKGDNDVKANAIIILYENVERMTASANLYIPACIGSWDVCLTPYVREFACLCLAKVLMTRPLVVWQSLFPEDANAIIGALGLGWLNENESDPRIRNDIGAVLNGVLSGFRNMGTLYHPKKAINTDELRIEVAKITASTSHAAETVRQLHRWVAGEASTRSQGVPASAKPLPP